MTVLTFPDGTVVRAQSAPVVTTIGPCCMCGEDDGAIHPFCLVAYELAEAIDAARSAGLREFERYERRIECPDGEIRTLIMIDYCLLWEWQTVDVCVAISPTGTRAAICSTPRLTPDQRAAVQEFVLDATGDAS